MCIWDPAFFGVKPAMVPEQCSRRRHRKEIEQLNSQPSAGVLPSDVWRVPGRCMTESSVTFVNKALVQKATTLDWPSCFDL